MKTKIKGFIRKVWNRCGQAITASISALTFFYITRPLPVFASSSYTTSIDKLKTVAITIVSAAGAVVLIYGGVKFAESFQKKDQNGEYNAVYTIISGGVMIGISALVTALT